MNHYSEFESAIQKLSVLFRSQGSYSKVEWAIQKLSEQIQKPRELFKSQVSYSEGECDIQKSSELFKSRVSYSDVERLFRRKVTFPCYFGRGRVYSNWFQTMKKIQEWLYRWQIGISLAQIILGVCLIWKVWPHSNSKLILLHNMCNDREYSSHPNKLGHVPKIVYCWQMLIEHIPNCRKWLHLSNWPFK